MQNLMQVYAHILNYPELLQLLLTVIGLSIQSAGGADDFQVGIT